MLVLRGQRDGAIKQVIWNPLRGKEAKGVDDGMFFCPGFLAILRFFAFALVQDNTLFRKIASIRCLNRISKTSARTQSNRPRRLAQELEREGLSTTDMLDAPISAAQLASSKDKKKKKGAL